MALRKFLINSIQQILGRFGYVIVRKYKQHTMEDSFRALKMRKHQFQTVIDIGASDGRWSGSMMDYFPDCQYLLIEAQPVHQPGLQKFCQAHSNSQFILAAAGGRQGKIYFDASHPLHGQASDTPYSDHNIEVPVTTVDHEIQSRGLKGPFLLKLDTHGFEVPIFEGAVQTLAQTEIIIVECYNFRIAPDALLFHEMTAYLEKQGFRCIDLADPTFRLHDQAFWQMDLIFARADNPAFSFARFE